MKMITIESTCPICGKTTPIHVYEEDYWKWVGGDLAQEAFWYLSNEEREMLISGTCPECWEKMFSDPDIDEEEIEEEDLDLPCDYEESFDLEVGFDPYEGCYTFDC